MTFLDEEMIVAAAFGRRDAVQASLAKGANIHAVYPRTENGASPGTAMLNAFSCSHPLVCLDLHLAGDITATSAGWSDLMTAYSAHNRDPKMVMVAKLIGLPLSSKYATAPLRAAAALSKLECAVKLNHAGALTQLLDSDPSISPEDVAGAISIAKRGRFKASEDVLRSVAARCAAEAAIAELVRQSAAAP